MSLSKHSLTQCLKWNFILTVLSLKQNQYYASETPINLNLISSSVCYFLTIIQNNLHFFNVYLFLRERERETEQEWGRGRERGKHRIQSRLQALSCQPRDRYGAWTHEPWDHDLSRSWTFNWQSHPGDPQNVI